jgi:hypothetical protein
MSLPDLDTSNIGFIAFWNALDQGGAPDIDPATAEGAFSTTQEYSNGIDGSYLLTTAAVDNREIKGRIKDDGWIIVWLDRSFDEATRVSSGSTLNGPYDIVTDWGANNAGDWTSNFALADAINDIRNSLSTSTSFNRGGVGVYNFNYEPATDFTIVSDEISSGTNTFDFTPSVNNLYQVAVCGASRELDVYAGNEGRADFAVNQENVPIARAVVGEGSEIGARDPLSRNEVSVGETITCQLEGRTDIDGTYRSSLNIIITWD